MAQKATAEVGQHAAVAHSMESQEEFEKRVLRLREAEKRIVEPVKLTRCGMRDAPGAPNRSHYHSMQPKNKRIGTSKRVPPLARGSGLSRSEYTPPVGSQHL